MKNLKILIIEDLSSDVELIKRELRALGRPYETRVVQDEAGLRHELATFKPDVVLSDYMLPRFTGMEALKVVQRFDMDLPFIIVTGSMNELVAVECLKAGTWDYVIKEKLSKLVPAIQSALQKRALIKENRAAQQALEESEARYRDLVENSTNLICTHDLEGNLLWVNQAGILETGYSMELLLKMNITDLLSSEERPYLQDYLMEIKTKGKASGVMKVQTADGETRFWEYNSSLRSEGVEKSFVRGILRDVTDQMQAEERLRLQSAALEAAANTIVITDRDGTIQWVNSAFTQLTGYAVEEALGENPRLLKSGRHDLAFYENLWRTILSGQVWHSELINKRKDGSLYTEEMTITPVQDSHRQITHFIAIKQDISERKEVEAERERLLAQIHDQAQQMEQTLNTVPDGVLLLDADRRVLLANPVAQGDLAVLAAAKEGEVLTRLGDHALSELLASPPKGLWHELIAQGRIFEVLARPVGNSAHTPGWVLVIREVTRAREEQQRLQQQARLAAVGQLAAGIAHDFNNILAVILLYAQMERKNRDLSPKTHKRLETIAQQAKRASALVEQILDFSRRAVLERRSMDLLPFLKEEVKLLQRTLPENINIKLHYGPDAYRVNADPTRMQQVLLNLAVNARDALPTGGELLVSLEQIRVEDSKQAPLPEITAGEWVRITVADTGTGIPPEILAHIFEPFFTTKAPGKGSGLGLAQVYGIVKQHDGYIDVTSKVREGTRVTIYLPALLSANNVSSLATMTEMPHGQGELILLVEDNETTREAVAESLALLNYQVLIAANGQEALSLYEQHKAHIALVLSDLIMPEMGGEELFFALRKRDPAVKVVILTGHPKEQDLKRLQAAGLNGWLLKALSLEQLAQVVAHALR